ncbi:MULTISPECIES: hypothetical protein [Fructobacillus]|uniref:Uncharacterized protein n=2 Tax=Fructobacillus TaxID=559173 RepID=A0ABN9YWQ0_9LACO|nr:hypothetical protein [Fructobacillus apis]CAK1249409.1 unnamed protein product [Fructobacillus fructosus]MCO0831943.1 hypothetical protein [Fructobacillus apis]CAK1250781.1 unnamed protein product [Fructobacillus fructosus]CAK1251030.1 unnamed protein product [Fructobacillus fructosus]CAK1252629.1 unnamed protein product [Fructobacillus fructosus]
MTNSMFWNEVIGWIFTTGAVASFIYLVTLSLDKKPLFGDNDTDRDIANNERKKAQRLYKQQKKALKAATKRAKA